MDSFPTFPSNGELCQRSWVCFAAEVGSVLLGVGRILNGGALPSKYLWIVAHVNACPCKQADILHAMSGSLYTNSIISCSDFHRNSNVSVFLICGIGPWLLLTRVGDWPTQIGQRCLGSAELRRGRWWGRWRLWQSRLPTTRGACGCSFFIGIDRINQFYKSVW
jgi:hypothetical protein